MRVLLTGATGFIGANVARLVVGEGHEVLALGRAESNRARIADIASSMSFINADLRDVERVAALVRQARADVCVHLGWYAEPGKYWTSPINFELVAASMSLATALADAGCRRFVGVGTCVEHDTSYGLLSERTPLGAEHVYSSAKAALGMMLQQLGASSGMRVAWARIFYLYGPHEDPRRLVSSVTRKLLRGERAATTAGAQVRDFLHVEDVASALWAIAQSELEGAVNVGSGVPVTVGDVVRNLGAITGREDLLDLGAVPYQAGEPMFVCADTRRLRETSFVPRYSLVDGLSQTVAWWRDHGGLA